MNCEERMICWSQVPEDHVSWDILTTTHTHCEIFHLIGTSMPPDCPCENLHEDTRPPSSPSASYVYRMGIVKIR